jgi:hypothetical protein
MATAACCGTGGGCGSGGCGTSLPASPFAFDSDLLLPVIHAPERELVAARAVEEQFYVPLKVLS